MNTIPIPGGGGDGDLLPDGRLAVGDDLLAARRDPGTVALDVVEGLDADALDGKISVESTVDEGTCFTLRFKGMT